MIELTTKQQAVYDFLVDYIAHYGYSPTYKDIGERFEIIPTSARKHIMALEAKGILSRTEGTARSIVMGNKSFPLAKPEVPVE
ncbi:hypothetical protein LCGC14_2033620 [marine sediment metagenome]|uniref:LexA repressor DNA-binding domain-containing protein n=1 Tax=marine sediment metagenome TaxID=412755 RepID=A0A0F9EU64_9ZZZZ